MVFAPWWGGRVWVDAAAAGRQADSGLGFMKVWALTKTQMEQLPEAQKAHMKVIDPRELAKQKQQQHRAQEAKVKAKAVDVKKLDADSLKAVPPEVIGQLSPEQMKHISARQVRDFQGNSGEYRRTKRGS